MRKLLLTIVALATITSTLPSCNVYHGLSSATKYSQLSANPFMQKIAKSLFTNVSEQVIGKGLTSFKGKPKLLSPLNSLFNTTESVGAFKNVLTNSYGISPNTVASNYSKWGTMKDVIGFVAKNAKKVDFNSYSWPK